MICADFDSLASYFQIFIVLKPRRYISNLGLGFIDAIIEATGKVAKRKMSFAKL